MSDVGVGGTRQERLRRNSAERRARQRLDLRRAILGAATDLFAREGYEGFSLRQVAEAIGYSPTAIYLHFTDKDDLLHHVALEGFRSFGDELQRAFDGAGDTLERLRAVGLAYLRFGVSHPVHYRLMFMVRGEFLERPNPPGYGSVIDAFGVLERTVTEGLARGELPPRPAEVYTSFLWAHVHGLVSLHLATPHFPAEGLEALFLAHMEVFARGLRP
ncbi:TetR/AcrR family transcriptional regulator [Deinococcus planocerae]|uniref:TetR/AcrR family transcriptional regulator n=1 Tax=Deinococcus planocerae TaxID=1737569 RepID=UPI000C7ED4CC|nr:TetR/AcrR family transcriptional regulator [Deinococcus planocerae]